MKRIEFGLSVGIAVLLGFSVYPSLARAERKITQTIYVKLMGESELHDSIWGAFKEKLCFLESDLGSGPRYEGECHAFRRFRPERALGASDRVYEVRLYPNRFSLRSLKRGARGRLVPESAVGGVFAVMATENGAYSQRLARELIAASFQSARPKVSPRR